ncbi:MAG: Na+/H+ antiporter NhaA [Silicimonas sp.]|nr:Na+/H+ antiporter NhaA [Silicimonas sp.]
MLLRAFDAFTKSETSSGLLLIASAVAAMVAANSVFASTYESVLGAYLTIEIAGEGLSKPLILWINDGLMAIFFFLIGLELKKELLEGKLKNPRDVLLPGIAAVGGMLFPALVFVYFNAGDPRAITGWAIPAATDIAFALGILALVGSRAPVSLKVFLLTLAILDDMGAILIIALFYTSNLQVEYLLYALIPFALMLWLNTERVHRTGLLLLLGVMMWVLVLKSGVHATLAGVVTAFLVPIKDRWGKSPLHSLEHSLTPWVYIFIVPIFAFANAGVVLTGLSPSDFLQPLPMGIALGLIAGKQVGVFGLTFLVVKSGMARLPHGANWVHIYGVACLAGIGFTMSLFIGSLSFSDQILMNQVRMGVLSGSLVSAIMGYALLMMAGNPEDEQAQKAPEAVAAE